MQQTRGVSWWNLICCLWKMTEQVWCLLDAGISGKMMICMTLLLVFWGVSNRRFMANYILSLKTKNQKLLLWVILNFWFLLTFFYYFFELFLIKFNFDLLFLLFLWVILNFYFFKFFFLISDFYFLFFITLSYSKFNLIFTSFFINSLSYY